MGETGHAGEGDACAVQNAQGHVDIARADDDGAEVPGQGFAAGGIDFFLFQIGTRKAEFEAARYVLIRS